VQENFLLLEVAEGGATGSGPSDSYLSYGIPCEVEWCGVAWKAVDHLKAA
jgi:hypothetical protein